MASYLTNLRHDQVLCSKLTLVQLVLHTRTKREHCKTDLTSHCNPADEPQEHLPLSVLCPIGKTLQFNAIEQNFVHVVRIHNYRVPPTYIIILPSFNR